MFLFSHDLATVVEVGADVIRMEYPADPAYFYNRSIEFTTISPGFVTTKLNPIKITCGRYLFNISCRGIDKNTDSAYGGFALRLPDIGYVASNDDGIAASEKQVKKWGKSALVSCLVDQAE